MTSSTKKTKLNFFFLCKLEDLPHFFRVWTAL